MIDERLHSKEMVKSFLSEYLSDENNYLILRDGNKITIETAVF